ncbi:MAG: hypothetical protein JNL01_02240 [Bdellovibrionales bacterium]|nr:hypothetical protein [Bdellovibrionales bacterium]
MKQLLVFTAFLQIFVGASAMGSEKPWYEKISLRGYTQLRYNRLLETNGLLKCEQCDKSIGNNGGFFFRRGRLIFSGDVHDRVYIYIQPDFASDGGAVSQIFQMRDAYFDVALDAAKEFRFRLGQSKIPYGFENLQSSQNRAPLDRADSLNSGVANERDIGVMFYWAPAEIRKRFRDLQNASMKGSGDYGVFGLGIYNGQTANRSEMNNNRHIVAKFTYPVALPGDQIVEAGVSGYSGLFSTSANTEFADQRVAGHFVWYPRPIGLVAEFTTGRGPMFRRDMGGTIQTENLSGGYVQLMGNIEKSDQRFTPFARLQFYHGGKKHETNAPKYIVRELEMGNEWSPFPAFELNAAYVISSRYVDSSTASAVNDQQGNFLRLQAQFNY